jgi:hypothetical protein
LHHGQTDAFNRQNRTIGISEISLNRTCCAHGKIVASDPIPDLQRFGAFPSAAVSIWPMRLGDLLVDASTAQFTQESLGLPQVKRV